MRYLLGSACGYSEALMGPRRPSALQATSRLRSSTSSRCTSKCAPKRSHRIGHSRGKRRPAPRSTRFRPARRSPFQATRGARHDGATRGMHAARRRRVRKAVGGRCRRTSCSSRALATTSRTPPAAAPVRPLGSRVRADARTPMRCARARSGPLRLAFAPTRAGRPLAHTRSRSRAFRSDGCAPKSVGKRRAVSVQP